MSAVYLSSVLAMASIFALDLGLAIAAGLQLLTLIAYEMPVSSITLIIVIELAARRYRRVAPRAREHPIRSCQAHRAFD
jgi:hypothetical protein